MSFRMISYYLLKVHSNAVKVGEWRLSPKILFHVLIVIYRPSNSSYQNAFKNLDISVILGHIDGCKLCK